MMTREELLQEILVEWEPPKDESCLIFLLNAEQPRHDIADYDNQWIAKIEAWVLKASIDRLNALIDLIITPVNLEPYQEVFAKKWGYDTFDQETLEHYLMNAATAWAEHDLRSFHQQAGSMLQEPSSRSIALAALGRVGSGESLPLLSPLVKEAGTLPAKDVSWLISTLSQIREHRARPLLLDLQTNVSETHPDLLNRVESALTYRTTQFGEKAN